MFGECEHGDDNRGDTHKRDSYRDEQPKDSARSERFVAIWRRDDHAGMIIFANGIERVESIKIVLCEARVRTVFGM